MIGSRRSRIGRRASALTATLAASLCASPAWAQDAAAPAPPPPPADPGLLKPLYFVPDPPKDPDVPFPVVPPIVSRSLTLPLGVLSPSLTMLADRPGARVSQSANVGIGLAIGAGRNTEVAGSLTPPFEGVTQMRVGFTFQMGDWAAFKWGIRPDFGATLYEDDAGRRVTVVRPGGSVPAVIMLGRFVRFDIALAANAYMSTRGEYRFAFTSRTIDPSLERPGFPVEFTLQLERSFHLGAESGVGMLPKSELVDHGDLHEGFFAPLGFFMGGTVIQANRPLVDIIGSFRFPYFLLAERGLWRDDPWQAGLTMRGFVEL